MKQLLLMGLIGLGLVKSQAQTLTLKVPAQPVQTTLEQLRVLSGYDFWYRPDQLPGMGPALELEQVSLDSALSALLQNTALDYLRYRDYAVVIGPASILRTRYSIAYFKAVQQAQTVVQSDQEQVWILGDKALINPQGSASVSLVVKENNSNEYLQGALVICSDPSVKKTLTDSKGTATLSIPTGIHRLEVQMVGYETLEGPIQVWNDGLLELRLNPESNSLSEVLIKAEAADANINKAQIGVTKIDAKTIKKLPTLLGEADVVRSLLIGTGVTSTGEGAAGFNVRGGDADQNLTLQGEMVLFNTNHALGFFSTYNTDLVQKVELYKTILPAEFGGRLSSVLDVQLSEGNFEKWKVKAGIGLVSARAGVEGPLKKNKTALIAGLRSSYSDWVLGLFKQTEIKNSSASFYDANLGLTHRLNKKNTLQVAGYMAGDAFVYNRQFGFEYQTAAGQLVFKHSFNDRSFSRFSAVLSQYQSTQTNYEGPRAAQFLNSVQYLKVKEKLHFQIRSGLQCDAGAELFQYRIQPGQQIPFGPTSVLPALSLETDRAIEAALFASVDWSSPSARWQINGGLRWNHYRLLGAKTVYQYNGAPAPETLIGSTRYGKGQTIQRYGSLEPRLSGRYRLGPSQSIKAGYSRTSQFINQIFNTDTPTPSSQFQLSTPYIPPFRAHNFSGGFFKNTRDNLWESSVEVFYRWIDQLWDYKDFANLVVNPQLEMELRTGVGRAYGLECSAKTTRPIFNGQVGYTYSRTQRKIQGINRGQWYASNFDKPHILNLLLNYQPNQRHTLTIQFTYSTGRPATAPVAGFRFDNNIIVPVYTERNQSRIPDYHRLDIAYTIGRGYNKKRTLRSSWNLSVYNVYARKNAFSVFFTQAPDLSTVSNRLAILGTVLPAVTLQIETL